MASKVPDILSLIELWRWELDKLHKLAVEYRNTVRESREWSVRQTSRRPCWCWNEFKSVATEQNKPESLPKEPKTLRLGASCLRSRMPMIGFPMGYLGMTLDRPTRMNRMYGAVAFRK